MNKIYINGRYLNTDNNEFEIENVIYETPMHYGRIQIPRYITVKEFLIINGYRYTVESTEVKYGDIFYDVTPFNGAIPLKKL